MAHFSVTLIAAGGTIDKLYPPDKGSYAFVFGDRAAAQAILERARVPVSAFVRLLPKDSMDMNDIDRGTVADYCEYAKTDVVVVTHGTDTIIKTAEVIASRDIGKTIVLVGAAQPEGMKDTDADFNLGFAFGAAQSLPAAGVYIAMNGDIFRWDCCEKGDDGIFRAKV